MSKRSRTRILDLMLLPLRGGDEGQQGAQPGDQGQQNNVQNDGQNNGKAGEDDDDDDDDDDLAGLEPAQRRIAELSREAGGYRKERNRIRKEKEALEAELNKIKNAGGSEKEQWEAELTAERKKNEELTSSMQNILIRSAVNEDGKYQWYDVPVVLGLLDRSQLEIDLEAGAVDGLSEELKRIAKEKPYLVKKVSGNGSSGGSGNGSNSGGNGAEVTGRTGNQPSGRTGSQDQAAAQRATLQNKYPALNQF